jgi:hypothetical protein
VGGRYEILSIGEYNFLPAIAVYLNLTIPTGRETLQAQKPLGSDVTGRGFWALGAGLTIEKTFSPIFVQWILGIKIPMPTHREDLDSPQRFGNIYQSALIGGFEFTEGLVASLLVRVTYEDVLTLNRVYKEHSSRLDLGASLALAWRFTPHWTLQTSIDSGIFTHGWGDNQPGRITWNIGVRYGYF